MKIKEIICGLIVLILCFQNQISAQIKVSAGRTAKMRVLVVTMGNEPELKIIAEILKKDFSFSGQFDVSIINHKTMPSKKIFNQWKDSGNLLAIFLNTSKEDDILEWRVYDTSRAVMLKGKKYKKRGPLIHGWAHNIADMIWPELMGGHSSFSTKIAYSKEIRKSPKHPQRHIYVADFDGSYPEPLITTPTINVAPRWNRDLNQPLLFYSESSRANISLRIATMDGGRKIASDFDGLNMLPAFTKDGKKVVYCVSHGHGQCHLWSYENGQIEQITHNNGNNISPSLSDDGNKVFFCSDYKNNTPLIYCCDRSHGSIEQLTDAGPCFSPSYCEKNNKLAYIKRVEGIMQIFIYDLTTCRHKQFTTDTTFHKEECSWSPCGNYLLFSLTRGSTSKLAIEHVSTRKRHFVTTYREHCGYPSWSPPYSVFPAVSSEISSVVS